MALYNEINVGRYNRTLQKLLGLKGGPPTPQLSSEVTVALSFFYGREMRYLESWDTFGALTTLVAGGAGNRSCMRLRNPSSSNVIAIIEKLVIINTDAAANIAQISQTNVNVNFAGTINVTALDARGRPGATCIPSQQNNAATAIAGTLFFQSMLAGLGHEEYVTDSIHELPLLPGNEYNVWDFNLNQSLTAAWLWRERTLEEGERQ